MIDTNRLSYLELYV